MQFKRFLIVGLCGVLTNGCIVTPPWQPGDAAPPAEQDYLLKHEDAIPRQEARSEYGNPETYTIHGLTYRVLSSAKGYREEGVASWYGTKFHGRRTSSGEIYDMYEMTAAHKTLPLPSYVRVTNLHNQKSVVVRVNDRGPFHDNRLIDLSYSAAQKIDVFQNGTAPVLVEHVASGSLISDEIGDFYLQVGAYSDKSTAESVKRLFWQQERLPVFIQKLEEQSLYRVRVGPIRSKLQGQAIIKKYQQSEFKSLKFIAKETDWDDEIKAQRRLE